MVPVTTSSHRRMCSREHMQTFVSVDKAAELQGLSLKRFQREAARDIKLGRMLGHVSVNKRSTEILRTATFLEDIAIELEDELMYDEDAQECEDLPSEASMFCSASAINTSIDNEMDLDAQSVVVEDLVEQPIVNTLVRYQPSILDSAVPYTQSGFLMDVDEDWMYDMLDLQVDLGSLIQPTPDPPLPKMVVVQIWRIILASLAGFAEWKVRFDSTSAMHQLEAYGAPKQDQLVGLGLEYSPAPYYSMNPYLPLMT